MSTTTTPPLKVVTFNPSPKNRFRNSPAPVISKHRDLVSSDQFDMTSDFAMLELVKNIVSQGETNPTNPNAAIAGFYRIMGAHELLSAMKTLAEAPTVTKAESTPANLDHRA